MLLNALAAASGIVATSHAELGLVFHSKCMSRCSFGAVLGTASTQVAFITVLHQFHAW